MSAIKRARKLAMTGGYEVVLEPTLTISQLEELKSWYGAELQGREDVGSPALVKSSLSGRVLQLIEDRILCLEGKGPDIQ
ncbi:MAG: hypothetical protein KDD60_06560 [Bdellovibrionales bacterium]|nr:hypothetical protein [Bdellovibrionales bacterium]